MTIQNDQGVVELPTAQVPADQGLSSLGLIIQLAGTLFAAYISLFMFMALMMMPRMGGGGEAMYIFLALGACIARSFFHRAAGTELLYGRRTLSETPVGSFGGVRRYIVVALIQTVVLALLLKMKFEAPTSAVIGVAGGLAAWPVILMALLMLPRFKRLEGAPLPIAEDKGFEGASILMAILGTCGAVAMGTILFMMLKMGGKAMQQGPMVLLLLSVAMLCVRSVIHVQAGLSGIRETSIDRSVELANRYANFGVISSFCAGGAILLMIMTVGMNVLGLAVIAGVCWMLMAWPLIIRRFFSDRQFADLLAGDGASLHRRAPDAGLTGLGWLLIAQAALGATFLIPQLVMGHAGVGGDGMEKMITALAGPMGMRSVWFSVGLTVLQGWAGYELVRMSAQHKFIAVAYGVIATGLTVYMIWPIIEMMKHSRGMFAGQELTMMIGPICIQLVVPVATLLLVARKIAPTATARFKPRAAESTSA